MKKIIAIVAGGDSSEWQVSMRSAAGLDSFIPSERYEKYIVVIIGQDWHVEHPSGEYRDHTLPSHKSHFKNSTAETSVSQYFNHNGRRACFKF